MIFSVTLSDLGWNSYFADAFAALKAKDWVPARLIRESPINYGAFLGDGEEIDVILDKISANGYDSLSAKEKEKLFSASKNKN